MIIIGVTGGIGSGKSHFCNSFAKVTGVKYLSSDKMVHDLYANNYEVLKYIKSNFPSAVIEDKIDRKILGQLVFKNPSQKKRLENFIYPILKKERLKFKRLFAKLGFRILLLEIPLLFENGLEDECDYTITIFCNKIIQKQRALKRLGMTEEKYFSISSSQMHNSEKLKKSCFKVNSGQNISQNIKKIMNSIQC